MLDPAARQIVALHEAGHAVAAFALGGEVERLEVTPDGDAGGCFHRMPVDASILDHMVMTVAGWVAEDVFGTPMGRACRPRVAGAVRLPEGKSDKDAVAEIFESLVRVAPAELAVTDADRATFIGIADRKAEEILWRHRSAVEGLASLLTRRTSVGGEQCLAVMLGHGVTRGSDAEPATRPAVAVAA